MKNFPTLFWKRFQDFKDAPAFVSLDEKGKTVEVSFWEWTRRVQNLAIALLEAKFLPETRLGLVAPNHRGYLDLAVAAWLVGGCVVPLSPGRDRKETLRCLGRSGAEWIAVWDDQERARLAGPGGQLPDHLKWIFLDGEKVGTNQFSLQIMEEEGRTLARRGRTRELAERIYGLKASAPTAIFFDPEPDGRSQGAFFSGKKVAFQFEGIAHQMDYTEAGGARFLSALSFGWFSSFQLAMATLLSGNALVLPSSLRAMPDEIRALRPTDLLVGPAYLESLSAEWQRRLENAPDLLKRLSSEEGEESSTLGKTLHSLGALGDLGDRAVRRFLYDPIRDDFGGLLKAIYIVDGKAPPGVHEILEKAGIDLLGLFGIPEAGVTHLEHRKARRPGTVGRPIEGVATKIAGAKSGEEGELWLRGDLLFDGYWAGEGRRQFDDEKWLPTGMNARLESGFAYLEGKKESS